MFVGYFFKNNSLYFTNFNRLYAFNGAVNFKFNEQKTEIFKPEKTNTLTSTTETPKKAAWDEWDAPLPSNNNTATAPQAEEPIVQFLNAGPSIEFNNINLAIVTANDSANCSKHKAFWILKMEI